MKAVVVARYGGPESLQYTDWPEPEAAPGTAVVRLDFAGINFIDIYMRSGFYARSHTYESPLPMTIGMEGAGTVVQVSPDVRDVTIGDRVAYCIVRGSYAQYAAVPAWKLVKIPPDVPLPVGTALMLQGLTAHYLSHSAFPLGPGKTCLVHAGAGGVGQLLIQLAKLRGATVITTVGSAAKAAIARSRGADHVVLYRETDFRSEVMKLTDNCGVDVVYDAVGKDTFFESLDSLRPLGMMVSFGNASGAVPAFNPLELSKRGSLFLTRPTLFHYVAKREDLLATAKELFAAVKSKKVKVRVGQTYALEDAAQAHMDLEARKTTGSTVLIP